MNKKLIDFVSSFFLPYGKIVYSWLNLFHSKSDEKKRQKCELNKNIENKIDGQTTLKCY